MSPFDDETKCSLAEIAAFLPARQGRKVHRCTILRWIRQGVRGIRLEAVRIGNVWLSSPEALRRFLDRLRRG